MAHLQSIAVDFAKHGEPVDPKIVERIEKRIEAWPEFFEKSHKEMRQSNGILGKLYRDISNDQALQQLLESDFSTAIECRYTLDKRILNQVKDWKLMLSYLQEVYSKIVRPMVLRLRNLMMEMNFGCEAEIFASDLRFKMFDDSQSNMYKGQVPLKNEDAMTSLKARLNRIIELF